MRGKFYCGAVSALLLTMSGGIAGPAGAATTGDLVGTQQLSWTENTTPITMSAELNLNVVSRSETAGYFKFYTRATSTQPMINMCNQTIIVLRAVGRTSSFRPVLTWEGVDGPVMFDYYDKKVVRDRTNDYYYRGTKCAPSGSKVAGWSSPSSNRLAWSGAWAVKRVSVTVRAKAYSSDGVLRRQVAVADVES